MKKLLFITVLMAGIAGIVFGADAPSPYFTGDGGKDISLAVLVPEGRGLAADQNYLPTLVQGVFVSDFTKFSNIQVLGRQNLEKVLLETESGIYKDADFLKLGEIKIGYAMTGSITKTSSGYALQMQVVPTSTGANAVTRASYSANCTVAELDSFSAIRKASSELLAQLGVNLTAAGKTELLGAAPQNTVNAQTSLAKGISAQRGGTEVAALSYYYQAADIDPSLLEAASRASVLSANVTSGNIGADARSDIQWRKDWFARLRTTEEYFDGIFKKSSPPYTFFYSTGITQGNINYETETLPLSIEVNLHDSWSPSAQKALQAMYDGLNATKRKEVWGLAQWPVKRVTELNPFSYNSKNYSIMAELLDDKDRVIGRENFNVKGEWSFDFSKDISIVSTENVFSTVTFSNVNANDITDRLTIRIASVNGIDAWTAAQRGVLQIQALLKSEWDNNLNLKKDFVFDGNTITGYKGNNRNISISAWGEPLFVSIIGVRAFADKNLTSVTIPNSITIIEREGFRNNALTSVIIPDSVTTIGNDAFNSNLLTSVTIPDSVTVIGNSVFSNNRLTSVTIPNGVTAIGNSAFYGNQLTSVSIGANVSIGINAFPYVIKTFYDNNGKKAGVYKLNNGRCTFQAR